MKFIIEIDGVTSTRYKYNVWKVFQYEDNSVSKDERIFCSDDKSEFEEFIKTLETIESD